MRTPRTIIVPTDLSESSVDALLYADEVARLFNAEIIALHVIDDRHSSQPHEAEFDARKSIIHLLMEHTIVPQNLRLEIIHGSPVEGIIRSIQHLRADLVVMSTHGRTGLQHALMGSVAEEVVRFSPVPVLIVKSDGPDEFAEFKKEEIKINLHLN